MEWWDILMEQDVMYRSQWELYQVLRLVLEVKMRINKYYGYNVTSEMIWEYLGKNKWKRDKNLSLAEMVNDIIVLDIGNVRRKMMGNE